ncbi:MAG: aminopeptidase P family protein [Hyphomicrobiaceae bacterium]|nr:aminopeptidase P family protein [Hyphomicrobiaceae bacterium]
MFQTFETAGGPEHVAARVKALRALLSKLKIDAFLIPRSDEFQGEYVPACAERLRWLTGFSGSAGLAVVTRKAALLMIDGRYTVQARSETDTDLFEVALLPRPRLSEWLIGKLSKGAVVGFDPWLHTASEVARLKAALDAHDITLKPVAKNLVDQLWGKDRPAPPDNEVIVQPLQLAGQAASEKIAGLQKTLKEAGQSAVVLTLADSICWLLNIRGADVAHNPVVRAFAIVPASGKVELFVAPGKITAAVRTHLAPFTKVLAPKDLQRRLRDLKSAGKPVRLDGDTAAFALERALGAKSIIKGADPCILPKAIKNSAEIAGSRAAHIRDGGAIVRYLAWLDAAAQGGRLDEISAVEKLEEFRRATNELREISFPTISGSGPHGAIVHYRVSEASNRDLKPGELLLLDSGAQYQDGTTDITRTIAIGTPTAEMKQRFTAVLRGHIAIATARFPKGTRGIDLDPFARRALWDMGADYDHGTGHGIGSYLSVHEGPQSISRAGMVPLQPGMLLSNEPGFYKEGAYGIRIENVVLVTEAEKISGGGEREMMGFETLTLAPIDKRLIVADMLSQSERDWLNGYHKTVFKMLSGELDTATKNWLKSATSPL